jgi:hypothetical protein
MIAGMPDETRGGAESRGRRIGARALTVLGALLLLVSVGANFVERQALSSDEVEQTAKLLIADQVVREHVAASLADELYAAVDVRGELRQALPEDQQALAGVIAGALRPLAERVAGELLERPRFQEAWADAVSRAHEQVIRVLDDKTRFVETEGGAVVMDLRPVLDELTQRLPITRRLAERLPENAGVFVLFEADELETAQQATRVLRAVADWLWILVLLAWAGAVYLAPSRRIELRAIAIAVTVVGLLVLLARRLVGSYVVDQLSTSTADEDAIRRAWNILTRLLADAGWAAIAIGVLALLGAWLVGPGARATSARGWLAPYLRSPGITYGTAALAFLVLVVWGPIAYVERPLTLLVLAGLAGLGIEVLRRTALRENATSEPDAGHG